MYNIITGGAAMQFDSTQSIEILNSHFYNIEGGIDGGCVSLTANAKHIIRNSIFEQCATTTKAGAIYAPQPGVGSIFEDLTFKYNYAEQYAADLYINSNGRQDGDIIINGSWLISGSMSTDQSPSSMYIMNDNNLPITWTITMNDWTIEGITNHPGIYFDRVDFIFNNLNATNNTHSVIDFVESIDTRNYTHIIQNSYFTLNKDILFSYENYIFKAGSSLALINNIFDNNDGILYLQIDHSTSVSSPISITKSEVINHDATTNPLFTISSDEGSSCSSKGLGHNWAVNDRLIFEELTFDNNIDTQFTDIICVQVNINNITFNIHERSMMLFDDYSLPLITHLKNTGNKGTLITLRNTNTATLQYHYTTSHTGNYIIYNASETFSGNDELILKDIEFDSCNSEYNTINEWFITISGSIERVSTMQFLLERVVFNDNNGQLISSEVTDTTGVDLGACPNVLTDSYINGEIEFIDCTFDSNKANSIDAVFMQFHWSIIEIGDSSIFSNNNDYDILIQLIDSTITLDNTQFDGNDNINYVIDFGRQLEIGTTGNEFCALNLDINGSVSVVNNAFIHFTDVTDMDSLSITQSNILGTNVNAFISGNAALNQNDTTIILKHLNVLNFGGSFVHFEEEDRELLNIEFTDSDFDANSEQLIFVNTFSNTASKTFTFDNISISNVPATEKSLFDINSNGGTEINIIIDYLTFTNVNNEYYFDINGSINYYFRKHNVIDKSDGFLRATDALNIIISDVEFGEFTTLFEVNILDPLAATVMIVNNTKMYNGDTILKSYLGPGVSTEDALLLFTNCVYLDLTLTNDKNIFDIYSDGLNLNVTLDGGNFTNVINNGGSYISLNGGATLKILDITASNSHRFLTGVDVGSVNVINSHFTEFEEAIQIIRNNTVKWPDASKMNVQSSTFASSTDSHTIIISQLSIRDELLIQYSNFSNRSHCHL